MFGNECVAIADCCAFVWNAESREDEDWGTKGGHCRE